MPERVVESFSVKRLEVLDAQGNIDSSLAPKLTVYYNRLSFAYAFTILGR